MLFPMASLKTNKRISGFPKTPHAIAGLTNPRINTILQELKLDTQGSIALRIEASGIHRANKSSSLIFDNYVEK
jgi:hypothetical protein